MSHAFVEGTVTVTVPASSANLGPGFDAAGLALGLYDEVTAEVVPGLLTVDVDVEGEGADEVPRDATHLVVRSMARTFEAMGCPPPGLRLRCRNGVPHGRGLGSSSAAIVAGVVAARGLLRAGRSLLPDDDALVLAAAIEGHPDNVAPALLGGFTIAYAGAGGRVRAVRLEVGAEVRPVVFVPPDALATSVARGLLPATVPHADAAANAGRSALLVAALTTRPGLLLDATEDRLHQPYRASAMPETATLVEALRAMGIAACVSGAGPTVLALCRPGQEARAREPVPAGWRALGLEVDRVGARVTGEGRSRSS